MSNNLENIFLLYEDTDYFQECVFNTAEKRGLVPSLVEKDYYCSMLLSFLFVVSDIPLVFRGGTCLSKVYADFFRLSEDCDFIVPVAPATSRSARRQAVKPVKNRLGKIEDELPCFGFVEDFKGHNESTQYIGKLSYTPITGPAPGIIKIEVGLREPLLLDSVRIRAQTALVDPFTNRPCVNPFTIRAMSLSEAYAEKARAALTRRQPAIRDFFDLHYAHRTGRIDLQDESFVQLVRQKLSVPGNQPVDISEEKNHILERQIETTLKPVVNDTQLQLFDLPEMLHKLQQLAETIQSRQ